MQTRNIVLRYGLGLFTLVLLALSISHIAHSSNTNELLFKQEASQLINLGEFTVVPISCNVIFDVYKFGYCKNLPFHYNSKAPESYNKEIYYFNVKTHINYTKIKKCQIDDMILYINKLDTRFMNMFWIIS